MIEREITSELNTLLTEYPIVTVIGPRQAGKTTLVRHTLPEFNYVNLESPDTRAFAQEDPRAFLAEYTEPLILDEIQRVPTLLSYLQERVDEKSGNGRFVITGSHQLELRAAVTQSLAGRTAILTLYPLSITELASTGIRWEHFDNYLLNGFLPRVHDKSQRPAPAYSNYLQTYVERDVRQLIRLKDVALFEKFLSLLAGRVGQLVNYSSLGNDIGVDDKTVKQWLSVLEASFVIFRLQPYFENFGKRVMKSPKIYFTEPGLLTHLLGLERTDQIRRDPLIGGLFENLVIVEALKSRSNRGLKPELYFFRDHNGLEIDLLLRQGRDLTGVEIKSASTLHQKMRAGLLRFDKKVTPLAHKFLVYNSPSGDEASRRWSDGVEAIGFRALGEKLEQKRLSTADRKGSIQSK